MTPTFVKGARTFGKLGAPPAKVIFHSAPCMGYTRPMPSEAALDLARSHPRKSWARRFLRLHGRFS